MTWQQIDSLSGTAQKTIDFSKYDEVYLATTCAGNTKLIYTAKIPVVTLGENKIQCATADILPELERSANGKFQKTSCRLLACYVGGTNYTGSQTSIYVR